MRHGSPPDSKITGDAKEAVDNCLVEFCAVFIAAAVEECRRDKRTTVTGDDLILALNNLGFEDYVRPLAVYLRRFREVEGNRPRARHSSMAALDPTAPAVEALQPPSPDPTLQLELT
ncbi:nuclear transcription factor Y subunit B-1-like [Panicum miliaceum]|uniref:Nuclear transcription factor Y subunit B-1-like n=1 Tax=Panicum miliaceum TaxID=4540 RepID=A0A3L6RYH3_PANMI|nr:nuclear transcription factor Y subunit B-1-like [Panicum miliaceum]